MIARTETESVTREPLLQLKNISKQFPGVRALDNVSLDIYPGEVLALIGENGAGKSTLLRVLNGDYAPDQGEIVFRGHPVAFASPADSHHSGIRVIYQEPEIVPEVSVAENIYVGEVPRRLGRFVDWRRLNADAHLLLQEVGVAEEIDPPKRRTCSALPNGKWWRSPAL
ncbi:MAG: sugar ABC transporter ATP-binding protein [Anaerolineales bacterium]|nr:sugar ABC transporter ATP-binding protein [Anaerolineales bacterium]